MKYACLPSHCHPSIHPRSVTQPALADDALARCQERAPALEHRNNEAVTQAEARSAAKALRGILGSEPGSTPICQLFPRRSLDQDPEFEWVSEPEPEPAATAPEPAVLVLVPVTCVCPTGSPQPIRRHRRHRGRRGRRGQKHQDVEPEQCFSPVREHEEKERRERPPRRYDKRECDRDL